MYCRVDIADYKTFVSRSVGEKLFKKEKNEKREELKRALFIG